MDFNPDADLTATFQQYRLAYEILKQENSSYRNKLHTLDKQIEATDNLLQTLSQQEPEGVIKIDNLLGQLNKELETTTEESRLEEELRVKESKFADLLKETEEDKKNHELEKQKIEDGMKTDVKNLIQEVEVLKNQIQAYSTENTNLQVELVSTEREYNKFQNDMEKLTESCNLLDLAKVELESKIASYKQTSNEELLHVERQQRLRIKDLNKTSQQLQAQLNNIKKS
ncbi:hypothetical protein WDU94_014315 [Cyamophila willieti]